MLGRRQTRDLLAWAREGDRLIEADTYRTLVEDQGQEHRVWLDETTQRYFKTTFPGRFGFSVIALPSGEPELVAATPLEYFDRLLLQNSTFGDALRLEGIACEQDGLVVVTSQPNVTGSPASLEEIDAFLRALWFRPLPRLHLGNLGARAFYRELDDLAVFDAHPGNFVKDTEGVILPIDLILVRAESPLQTALARYLI